MSVLRDTLFKCCIDSDAGVAATGQRWHWSSVHYKVGWTAATTSGSSTNTGNIPPTEGDTRASPPPPYSSLVFTTPYRPHDPKTRLASGSTMTRKHITHLKASCKSIASPGPRTSLLPVTWCPYTLQSRSGGVTSSSLPPPYLKIAPIDQQRFECLSHKSSVSSGRGVRTDPLATVRRDGLCRRRQSTS